MPNLRALVLAGMLSALLLICQMTAIKLVLVAQVISVKRTSAIMSIMLGYLFLKEKNIKERLLETIIIIIIIIIVGVVVIALLQRHIVFKNKHIILSLMRQQSSGMISPCQGGGPGSIPGYRMFRQETKDFVP